MKTFRTNKMAPCKFCGNQTLLVSGASALDVMRGKGMRCCDNCHDDLNKILKHHTDTCTNPACKGWCEGETS